MGCEKLVKKCLCDGILISLIRSVKGMGRERLQRIPAVKVSAEKFNFISVSYDVLSFCFNNCGDILQNSV